MMLATLIQGNDSSNFVRLKLFYFLNVPIVACPSHNESISLCKFDDNASWHKKKTESSIIDWLTFDNLIKCNHTSGQNNNDPTIAMYYSRVDIHCEETFTIQWWVVIVHHSEPINKKNKI